MADVEDTRKSLSVRSKSDRKGITSGKREQDSPCGPQRDTKQDQPSGASFRRLQAESQEVKKIIQPFLDAENGFMKDLESFLSRRDETKLRRKELLHKRWTEAVWVPLQSRVEQHVSCCSPVEVKMRHSLYSDYLHHCNTKGFVFLESYDLREYNPFLLRFKMSHFCKEKLRTADQKDPMDSQFPERQRGKRAGHSCYACEYSKRQEEKPAESDVTSQAALLQASSHYPGAARRKAAVEEETKGRRFGRLDTTPKYITATSAADGRCHQSDCRLSRWGRQRQPASLQPSSSSQNP